MKTLEEQYGHKCVHFNGYQHEKCDAGINYIESFPPHEGLMKHSPCFKENDGTYTCSKLRFPTQEEIKKHVDEINEAVKRMLDNSKNDKCVHCEKSVEEYVKVGRCVYAKPCNHRQWQGDVPKNTKAKTRVVPSDSPYDFDEE